MTQAASVAWSRTVAQPQPDSVSLMVLEVAILDVRSHQGPGFENAFRTAEPIISGARQPNSESAVRYLVPVLLTSAVPRYSGTVAGSVGSDTVNTRYRTDSVELPLRDTACSAPGGS